MYEVIKNIPANTELIVHYLPERPEEIFFMPAVHYLRNTLYRRTMDTILEGKSSPCNGELAYAYMYILIDCELFSRYVLRIVNCTHLYAFT